MNKTLSLDGYRLLGRSGLRVSPLSLGTMNFGSNWSWGISLEEARPIVDSYIERGGNFIDTANEYTNGTAEEYLGQLLEGRRDGLVIATKYTLPAAAGDPNSGGNHRKSMVLSVERSLRRLKTDYIDLLYLHAWDATTPAEEILRGMDDLVRSGKTLYIGVSNTPAWRISRMQAIADLRGWSPFIALQIEYSLAERAAERDLIPMARESGLGVIPWSPLKNGVLTGKYARSHRVAPRPGTFPPRSRGAVVVDSGHISDRNLEIAEIVRSIANETGTTPSQIALAWTLLSPGVTCPTIGVRTLEQLHENIGALAVQLTEAQRERLDDVSRIVLGYPHDYLPVLMSSTFMLGIMDKIVMPQVPRSG